jgi:uncharacterized protein (DUF433 family)
VGLVLDLLAGGMTADEILHEYPSLTIDDIQACLAFGSSLRGPGTSAAREHTIAASRRRLNDQPATAVR